MSTTTKQTDGSKRPISPAKKEKLNELMNLIKDHNIIAVASMGGIAARQIQNIRRSLRGQVTIRMAKNSMMKLALDQSKVKPKLNEIVDFIKGPSAFIFTNMSPFKLSLFLQQNRSPAPAKLGQIAPNDITVKAGDTGFPPGPVITQLQAVGIPTRISGGTVHIPEDTVVAREGDKIGLNLVIALSRLGIEPMLIGLNLSAAYDHGIILRDDVLNIDLDKVQNQLKAGTQEANKLALEINYITDSTLSLLITKAQQQALALSIETGIITSATLPILLAKASAQSSSLKLALSEGDSKAIQKPDKKNSKK